ncbi:MAG TPA: A/G-specific adenine glycosylase [Buchnera sp. (in: enterobacteria)]|nr:A/G-specific adenine glycosylase [Buchnera sp. (in: enterobacteria)]
MSNIIAQLLLNWYHFHGRKKLPWQKQKTPYVIWISEIMLQQTQVKTVIPYFKKFIKKFPTINSITQSSINEVLHIWSGLGYYKRAQYIYNTAHIIKNNYNSKIPDNFNSLIKLPGIGRSTAGAILSFSYNYYYAILDGNVKRIIYRYYAIDKNKQIEKKDEKLWNIVYKIIPVHNAGKFNQAIMDLGALICVRSIPKCNICPLKKYCLYYKNDHLKKYSLSNNAYKKRKYIFYFIILQYKYFIFLEQRPQNGIWPNLFSFPTFSNKKDIMNWMKKYHIKENKKNIITPFFHSLTHLELYIKPIYSTVQYAKKNMLNNNISIWYNLITSQSIGLPSPIKKILNITKRFYKDKYNKRENITQ